MSLNNSGSILANNAGIRNFSLSQSHSNLRVSPQKPVWTQRQSEPYLHIYADKEATINTSKSQTSFKNVKVMDEHVYKMHTGDNGSTRKENCRSCSRGAKNHCWPENRKIKIPSKPRFPRFLKRIANKSRKSPKATSIEQPRKSLETASTSINPILGLETTVTPTM